MSWKGSICNATTERGKMKPLDLRPEAIWRKRFLASNISWAVTAPLNPQHGLVCTNKDGIYQLYTWDVPTGELVQVTQQPTGVVSGHLSSDGNFIYFLKDQGGNEIGHFFRVAFSGGEAQDISPELPAYSAFSMAENHLGNVITFGTAEQDGYKVYLKRGDEAPTLLYHGASLTNGPSLSSDGRIVAIGSTERTRTLDFSLLVIDTETGQQIRELCDENASVWGAFFSPLPGDARLVSTSNQSGFERPFLWDALTGEREFLPLDEIPGSLHPFSWSDDARRILLCQIHQAQYQLYCYEVATHGVWKLDHPAGTLGLWIGGFFAPHGEIWTTWEDSAHPPCLIAVDEKTGQFKRVVLQAAETPAGKTFQSISLPSENGDLIQGWLAVPDGEGPFPTILETHGGPTWVMSSLFSPGAQCWLDHGFAYFTLNYHGSTTFGHAFEKSIWGNLGDLEIQDMAAAYKWLVENKIAQPDAVLLTGASYGGYLTLQAIGRRPDLWAGGMAQIAIADWKTLYEDESDSLRGLQRAFFGGAPDEVPEATRKSSPITYAEQIRAPILVIQGENDTRCPAQQMKIYEEKLLSLGKQIEVYWFTAGHGSKAQEQQIKHQELMLEFAYRVLG
jgi:dipeptidyl aminopeptidase/acylaminoacyl peptidase